MSDAHKKSVAAALNRFMTKAAKQAAQPKPSRTNQKPEKEVEKECLKWMRDKGWNVQIYEAKATWSPAAGQWLQQGMKSGTCDCMGSTSDGHMVAVEFKAPGRLSTFNSQDRYNQRKFIVDKINSNCFACVTDSAARLEFIFTTWVKIPDASERRTYLLSMLPQQKESTKPSPKLFEDD